MTFEKSEAHKLKRRNLTKLTLFFNQEIKVIESQFLYSELSMVAEIGGYVGLFLGFSIYQITDLMDYVFQKI